MSTAAKKRPRTIPRPNQSPRRKPGESFADYLDRKPPFDYEADALWRKTLTAPMKALLKKFVGALDEGRTLRASTLDARMLRELENRCLVHRTAGYGAKNYSLTNDGALLANDLWERTINRSPRRSQSLRKV